MSNIAHFFDFDCLINLTQRAWVVDINQPNQPLYKISASEFKMIKNGIYKKKGNKIEFNGIQYYLPDDMWNKLKIISTKRNININDFVISLQEFINKEIIGDFDFELNLNPILNLKNKMDDFYIICSKQTKNNYSKLFEKIEQELLINGIKIKNFYFLSQNFLNQNSDNNQYKQLRLLLQHCVGYKSEGDKFINTEITKYEIINFYDRSIGIQILDLKLKDVLNFLIKNTDKGLSDVIKEDLRETKPTVYFYKIEDNNFNPNKITKVNLTMDYLIKKFESFKLYL